MTWHDVFDFLAEGGFIGVRPFRQDARVKLNSRDVFDPGDLPDFAGGIAFDLDRGSFGWGRVLWHCLVTIDNEGANASGKFADTTSVLHEVVGRA